MDEVSIPTVDWFELDSETIDTLYSVLESEKQVESSEQHPQQSISDYWTQSDESSSIEPIHMQTTTTLEASNVVPNLGNPISLASLELLNKSCWRKIYPVQHSKCRWPFDVHPSVCFSTLGAFDGGNKGHGTCSPPLSCCRRSGSPAISSRLPIHYTLPESLTCHQHIPFSQVMQFAGVQAVIENVKTATKIHLVDFNIRSGIQCTVLMQAVAEQRDHPIELLKITAIGHQERGKIEETGKRLQGFASSLNLPFSFDIVFLSDMKDLREESINVKADETVAVYCNTVLRTMISRPDCLSNLMRVMRTLKPSVVVVCEVEANHNSPSFLNRFVEALFFYGTLFDCFEDCLDRDNLSRKRIEAFHIGEGIRNMIAADGDERFARNVKLEVWRAFFARFRMVEIELSESSWYQANLILKQFPHGSSCSIQNDGKGLIVGWKGTPIQSVSIWKFL